MNNFTIPADGFSNIGGVAYFWFAPIEKVQSIPDVNSTLKAISAPVTWKDGGTFLSGYSTIEKQSLSIRSSFGSNGRSFDVELSGFWPGHDESMSELLDLMNGQQFIVLAEDNEAKRRLLGTLDEPMIFSFGEWGAGTANSGGRGYKFSFSRKMSYNPPFYLPNSTDLGLGIGSMQIGSTFVVY